MTSTRKNRNEKEKNYLFFFLRHTKKIGGIKNRKDYKTRKKTKIRNPIERIKLNVIVKEEEEKNDKNELRLSQLIIIFVVSHVHFS
jgi:hypothetical protein